MDISNAQLILFPVQMSEFINLMRIMIREEIRAQKAENIKQQKNEWMDLDQLLDYLPQKLAKSTLYVKLAAGEIPGHKNSRSKKWTFLKSEIDAYLRSGKQLSNSEIIDAADKSLVQHA